MVTSPYEWKILDLDDQPQTNKKQNTKPCQKPYKFDL